MEAVEQEGKELLRVVLVDAVERRRELDDRFLKMAEHIQSAASRYWRITGKTRQLTRNDNG